MEEAPAVVLTATAPEDHDELLSLFRDVVAAGEGYPQDPALPVSAEDFAAYWLTPSVVNVVARLDGRLVGGFTMKPNGVGRAAHVANAGFVVARDVRGRGIGELLVRHAMERACELGFDAMQFNFVFETNPARRLYERLGFEVVGRVPEVIGDEAVLIYWRRLTC
jgi:ribosomal protein S18 acetylase RimI-like enzyme